MISADFLGTLTATLVVTIACATASITTAEFANVFRSNIQRASSCFLDLKVILLCSGPLLPILNPWFHVFSESSVSCLLRVDDVM